jgi:hypothetical protein
VTAVLGNVTFLALTLYFESVVKLLDFKTTSEALGQSIEYCPSISLPPIVFELEYNLIKPVILSDFK